MQKLSSTKPVPSAKKVGDRREKPFGPNRTFLVFILSVTVKWAPTLSEEGSTDGPVRWWWQERGLDPNSVENTGSVLRYLWDLKVRLKEAQSVIGGRVKRGWEHRGPQPPWEVTEAVLKEARVKIKLISETCLAIG